MEGKEAAQTRAAERGGGGSGSTGKYRPNAIPYNNAYMEDILRGCSLFWGGKGERVVRDRVLMDGAGFVGGTGSIHSAPLPAS